MSKFQVVKFPYQVEENFESVVKKFRLQGETRFLRAGEGQKHAKKKKK